MNLVPFGPDVGDHQVHPGLLTAGQTIDLHMYFPFYGGLYNYTTVSKILQQLNTSVILALCKRVYVICYCPRPGPNNQRWTRRNRLASTAGSGNDCSVFVQTTGKHLERMSNLLTFLDQSKPQSSTACRCLLPSSNATIYVRPRLQFQH